MSIIQSFSSNSLRGILSRVKHAPIINPYIISISQGGGGGGGSSVTGDDFESYPTQALPDEWSPSWGDHPWTVEDLAGNQVLRANGTTLSAGSCLWAALGSVGDFDLTFRSQVTNVGSSIGAFWRADGVSYDTNTDRYQTWYSPGQNKIFLGKMISAAWTDIDDYSVGISVTTWYYIRVQMIGTAIKVGFGTTRAAAHAAWVIEVVETELSAGSIVPMFYNTPVGAGYFDDFEIEQL